MNISREDAQDSLEQIEAVASRTRKTIISRYDSGILILWGAVWFIAFIGTHFFLLWVWHMWTILGTVGIVGTILICWRQSRLAKPTKISADKKLGWRFFWFWTFLFAYMFIWLNILAPFNGRQMNAFMCTAIMFAYVTMGLWSRSYYILWLGLAVTCTTLVGFYLIPPSYYCLWMAPMAGGALLGTGLYIRLRWR